MSKETKRRSAERLFEAMGMIDDRIVSEAQQAYSSSTRTRPSASFKRALVISMAMIVLVTGMIGGFVISKMSDQGTNDSLDFDEADSTLTKSLDLVLIEAAETSAVESTPLELIDFFDGEVSLIWNYEGDSDYYKLVFEGSSADSAVRNQMSKATQEISPTSIDTVACKVWISYGNGEVVSPYLKESIGNIGYSTLFDYSPEVIPSEGFTSLVSDALGDR